MVIIRIEHTLLFMKKKLSEKLWFVLKLWIYLTGSIILTKFDNLWGSTIGVCMFIFTIAYAIENNPWKHELLDEEEQDETESTRRDFKNSSK